MKNFHIGIESVIEPFGLSRVTAVIFPFPVVWKKKGFRRLTMCSSEPGGALCVPCLFFIRLIFLRPGVVVPPGR